MCTEVSATIELVTQTMSNNREAEGPAMGIEFREWVVEIQNDAKSVNLCDEEKNWTITSIYRVPSFIREMKKASFTPEVVSFGPYHHNADHLRPVDQHKRRALVHFLNKAGKPLDQFIEAMRSIEKQLQGCYHNLDKKWKNPEHPDQFLMLMILDGCFMLDVLRMKDENYIKYRYAEHDPVFSSYGVSHRLPYIKRDMLVMENQLPLLVLKKLLEVECCQPHVNDDSINKLVLRFFGEMLEANITTGLGLHPLDVYRRSLLHDTPKRSPPPPNQATDEDEVMSSAVELRECGVKFERSKTTSLADIHFEDGILTLPTLRVDDSTECMLLNIVAFEHLHVGLGAEITSYVCFMDEIIDSEADVRLLHEKGIIKNTTGSHKLTADLFNTLPNEVTVDPKMRHTKVRAHVNKYCKRRWNTWKAGLRHRYFNSPWSMIALIAATLLLLLTGAQTFYATYQYYHPNDSSKLSPPPAPPR